MKIRIFTFGCKVNQYESQFYRETLVANEYSVVDSDDFAVGLINACCVTDRAEKEVARLIRKLAREGRDVWLTGCISEKSRNTGQDFPVRIIRREDFLSGRVFPESVNAISFFHNHARAFVKVEDGCPGTCSYCIVPLQRGKVHSRSVDEICHEVSCLAERHKEIVLTGVNIGFYGIDNGTNLKCLVKKLMNLAPGIRFRLSSIEVGHLNEDLIELLASWESFCPSFHIPLQSGSDRILKAMRRPYRVSDYLSTIESISGKIPDATFTTDAIVGFPGETSSDFRETLCVILRVGFLKVHVFPFSPRPGTEAYNLPDTIPSNEKHKRAQEAILCAEDAAHQCRKKFIGRIMEVLAEQQKGTKWSGRTENYLGVIFEGADDCRNKIIPVTLVGFCQVRQGRGEEYLEGRIADSAFAGM